MPGTFPSPYHPFGNAQRTVDGDHDLRYSYDRAGRLTAVESYVDPDLLPLKSFIYGTSSTSGTDWAGFASSIGYHTNQTVSEIVHSNGVVDGWGLDPWGIGRPGSISTTSGGQLLWGTGSFEYDGAGL